MLKSLFFNVGAKVLVIVCQLLALIITNHIIGAEGRGIFLAAITWSNTFFIFSHCSLSTGILNLSNKNGNNVYALAHLSVIAAFVLGIISILMAFLFYGLLPELFNNLNVKYLWLAFAAIPFMMLQQYGMAVVQVRGNFKAFNILYAAYAVCNFTGVFIIWIFNKTSVDLLININLAAWLITGFIAFYFMWPVRSSRKESPPVWRLLISTSLAAHFASIVTFAVSRSDILIINYFSTVKETGIYGLAVSIVQMLLILPLSIQNLLYHSLMGKSLQQQKAILLQYSRITFAVMFVCSACVMILSKPLVFIIGGKNFEEAILLFKYFLPAMLFYSMPMVLASQWNIMGIFKQVNAASVLVLIVSVVSNVVLVPIIGITGGAITFLAISIIAFIIHVWFVKKNLGPTEIGEIIFIKKSDLNFLFNRS